MSRSKIFLQRTFSTFTDTDHGRRQRLQDEPAGAQGPHDLSRHWGGQQGTVGQGPADIQRPEPVFLNVYGAQESIPMNGFRQPM